MDNNFLNEVVDVFDEAFDVACNAGSRSSQDKVVADTEPADEAIVQDLFAQIAANYAKPVKSFICELERGTGTKDWIGICRPVLQSISNAARGINLKEAERRMIVFDGTLLEAQNHSERLVAGAIRQQILAGYAMLVDILPEVFQISEKEQRCEDIIIRSLLKQIPGIGPVTVRKLYKAGSGSLNTLFLATKEDLASATSIPLALCEHICEKFQQYRSVVEAIPADAAQSGYRLYLSRLVRELRHQDEELDRTAAGGAKVVLETERRQRQQLRQHCLLQIIVILAELGEVNLIHKVQRLSFKRRIQRLEEYLVASGSLVEGASS